MPNWAWVGLGGACGAILRYGTFGLAQRWLPASLPWGTLSVNLIGSLAVGFLAGWFDAQAAAPTARFFWIVGVLGGFTTFSAFSMDSFALLRNGEYLPLALYVSLHLFGGLALTFVGYALSRQLPA